MRIFQGLVFFLLSVQLLQASQHDCMTYLTSKNAEENDEKVSFVVRRKTLDAYIVWDYLFYTIKSEKVVARLAGKDQSNTPYFKKFHDRGFFVKLLAKPLCPQCLHELRKESPDLWVPVMRNLDIALLQPFLTVQFKPELTIDEITAFNLAHGAKNVGQIHVGPHCYRVALDLSNPKSAIEIANTYMASGKVIFAEPELIYLMIPPGQ